MGNKEYLNMVNGMSKKGKTPRQFDDDIRIKSKSIFSKAVYSIGHKNRFHLEGGNIVNDGIPKLVMFSSGEYYFRIVVYILYMAACIRVFFDGIPLVASAIGDTVLVGVTYLVFMGLWFYWATGMLIRFVDMFIHLTNREVVSIYKATRYWLNIASIATVLVFALLYFEGLL